LRTTWPTSGSVEGEEHQVLEDLESHEEIARLTDRLLRKADAYGRLPTPVHDILAAAELEEASVTFLSASSIAQAPAHLRGVLSRISGKVHAVLDRRTREVHINPSIDLAGQQAYKRLHETSHDLFPWQHIDDGHTGFADNELTLSAKTTILFEREANQGAAELLFQRQRFTEMASDYAVSCAAVVELADRFGSSRHAAFRRYVETHRGPVAGVVLGRGPCGRDPLAFRRREAICSNTWRERFEDPAIWPRVLQAEPFSFLEQAHACAAVGRPAGEWQYPDRRNEITTLNVEAMSNSYRTFVLVWLPRRELFKRRRVIVSAA
jgi:IrrE N-terminal-like domain